jgi:hypothetical protein
MKKRNLNLTFDEAQIFLFFALALLGAFLLLRHVHIFYVSIKFPTLILNITYDKKKNSLHASLIFFGSPHHIEKETSLRKYIVLVFNFLTQTTIFGN